MANTWNQSGTTWGQNSYGLQTEANVPITGLSATTSLNIPNEFIQVQPGWGTLDWGENGWGTVNSAVFNLTGLSATTSVGSLSPDDQLSLIHI